MAVAVPLARLFDYLAPDDCAAGIVPGVRVLVPFGKGRKVGLVLAVTGQAECDLERLRPVLAVLDVEPLFSGLDLDFLHWAGRYYHHPPGEVLSTALPAALRQGKPAVLRVEPSYQLSPSGLAADLAQLGRAPRQLALLQKFRQLAVPLSATQIGPDKMALKALLAKQLLMISPSSMDVPAARQPVTMALVPNSDQQAAIDAIDSGLGRFGVYLLEGVTGSGKTEVYMRVIATVLEQGMQVLVLLPEINLTPQLERRFSRRFGGASIVSFHSRLSDSQRLHAWLSMQQGRAAIMLGTRSALFTPLRRPGLIILDEEHDSSFKQQEGFRFSARDVAVARAKYLHIPAVLGSATPSLESLDNAAKGRYWLLRLPTRAGNARPPALRLLDIRNKKMQGGLSESLIAVIRATLEQQQQVLLFLNRRGYAPVLICHGCGWVSRCRFCDANLVIHAGERLLRCHHCGAEQPLVQHCPACRGSQLQAVGMGTERLEETLHTLFPDKTVVRLDRDSTQRKGALEKYLNLIRGGKAHIILGTQMLAKGHHFPDVTLVAILDIDSGLFSIDFRGGEKLAQLIVQVAGRAGRGEQPGMVVLQTRQPQHPLLLTLLESGYRGFAEHALAERRQAGLPPYSYQALIRVQAGEIDAPQTFLQAVCALIAKANTGKTNVLGPVSAPMLKRCGQFRFQLLLQSPQRRDLHGLLDTVLPDILNLREARSVRWSVDVDPVDLF